MRRAHWQSLLRAAACGAGPPIQAPFYCRHTAHHHHHKNHYCTRVSFCSPTRPTGQPDPCERKYEVSVLSTRTDRGKERGALVRQPSDGQRGRPLAGCAATLSASPAPSLHVHRPPSPAAGGRTRRGRHARSSLLLGDGTTDWPFFGRRCSPEALPTASHRRSRRRPTLVVRLESGSGSSFYGEEARGIREGQIAVGPGGPRLSFLSPVTQVKGTNGEGESTAEVGRVYSITPNRLPLRPTSPPASTSPLSVPLPFSGRVECARPFFVFLLCRPTRADRAREGALLYSSVSGKLLLVRAESSHPVTQGVTVCLSGDTLTDRTAAAAARSADGSEAADRQGRQQQKNTDLIHFQRQTPSSSSTDLVCLTRAGQRPKQWSSTLLRPFRRRTRREPSDGTGERKQNSHNVGPCVTWDRDGKAAAAGGRTQAQGGLPARLPAHLPFHGLMQVPPYSTSGSGAQTLLSMSTTASPLPLGRRRVDGVEMNRQSR